MTVLPLRSRLRVAPFERLKPSARNRRTRWALRTFTSGTYVPIRRARAVFGEGGG